MVLPNFQCNNPACDEQSNSASATSTTSKSKCEFMEKCASSCAAYGRVCPCAARGAGQAACRAVDKLYTTDSNIFTEKPEFTKLNCEDLVISDKLGEGGFSVVHRVTLLHQNKDTASNKNSNNKYAVKYLKRKIMVEQHAFELGAADLAVEANFLAQLSHSNIVQLHGITSGSVETNVATGKECGFFILIDLLKDTLEHKIEVWREQQKQDKGSILSRLSSDFKEKRKLALMDRCKIAMQIADAMIYLHGRRIIYRDLKPDNIGFDDNGTVKLFDFGLAKELKKKHLDGTFKLTGNTGSRRYMAPEVAKEQHYGLPVDVFSFGILLHELASLEKPFLGYSANKHMIQVVMGGERPKIDSHHHFPMELQWLVKKAWSTEAEERPTFVAVKKCLQELVQDMGDSSAPKSPKFSRVGRYRSTGQNTPNSSNSKSSSSNTTPPPRMKKKSMNVEDDLPDFSKMKPLSKPSRQTKSLGFLRKN